MDDILPIYKRVIEYINSPLHNKTGRIGMFISHDEVIENFEHDLLILQESFEVNTDWKVISNQEIIKNTKNPHHTTEYKQRYVILFELMNGKGDENVVYKAEYNDSEFWILPQFHDEFIAWSLKQPEL
jgi:hypothetical protein